MDLLGEKIIEILIVDDDESVIFIYEYLLENKCKDFKFHINYCSNSAQALNLLKDVKINIIFQDLDLNEKLDGIDLFDIYQNKYPNIPVIVVSGSKSSAILIKALTHKVSTFISKDQLLNENFDNLIKMNVSLNLYKTENLILSKTNEKQELQLKIIGESFANLSHDIKNDISIFQSNIEQLEKHLKLKNIDASVKYLDKLKFWGDKLQDKSKNLLYFSKEREPEFKKFDLDLYLKQFVEDHQVALSKHDININYYSLNSPSFIFSDEHFLYRILKNLLENAKDNLISLKKSKKNITIHLKINSSSTIIHFEDNGSGIPQDILQNIHIKFNSSKGFNGTGLGLPVVHKSITELGGKINITTKINNGTIFEIILPNN